VVKELSCAPSLPWGLGGDCQEVGSETLERGDCVLVFTDGVVEGRSHLGEDFGVERLVDAWTREAASSGQPDEVLRRLVDEILSFNAGKLRDDASLMILCWRGPDPLAPQEAGRRP
jgi:serine phosphatase RsbU (regulator of sigma subunit)